MASRVGAKQLLWVDLDRREPDELDAVAEAVGLEPRAMARLAEASDRPDLTQYLHHIHLSLQALEANGATDDLAADPLSRKALDIVAGHGWVVTVHDGPLAALARLDATTEGETRLGELDAASFVGSIADEVLADYLEVVEDIERQIDRLDQRALHHPADRDVLSSIVRIRRRISFVRRTLAPHRVAFAALARPEMALHEELGQPWPGLTDRLQRALDAVEHLRELLLGSFDIHMGRAAQDANETMKRLTLLSAVLLPAVVLAGVMGMNFDMPFFEDTTNFWVVLVAMGVFALSLLGLARVRHWF
jgi:Mg2+ and Co2+ transporter CorA